VKAGSIDQPAAGASIPNDELVVRGWALFEDGAAASVEVWLEGVPLGRARLGLRRDDVGDALDDTDAPICGFELRAGLDPADARQATVKVVATSSGGEPHEFEPIAVTVAEPAALPAARAERVTRSGRGPGVRVLAFTNVLALGGASAYFSQLLRELQRRGRIEATVVTAVDGPLRAELEADGIPVHLLGPIALDDPEAYADRIDELAAWAGADDHQVVFVNTVTGLTLPGADLAGRLGLPAIWAIHESFHPALLWDGLAPEFRARGEAALGRAAFAVFAAEATRDLYLRHLADRSVTIPYGLDLAPIDAQREGFDRDRVRRELGISAGADLIVCVGTVEPRKAQVSLLLAFEAIAARHPSAYVAATAARARSRSRSGSRPRRGGPAP
jgi:D-inositol-3-phosphate glycosyltransferase